jgi:hypothetical protein
VIEGINVGDEYVGEKDGDCVGFSVIGKQRNES